MFKIVTSHGHEIAGGNEWCLCYASSKDLHARLSQVKLFQTYDEAVSYLEGPLGFDGRYDDWRQEGLKIVGA
jgi:hypothetical protein